MKTTILIVEDMPAELDVLSCQLTDAGYEVIAAADGQEGKRLIRNRHFDAAIIDLTIPFISGRQLIVELREINKRVPVIVLSGDLEDVAQTDTAGNGADYFIQKPYRHRVLLGWLERLLKRSAEPDAHVLRFSEGELDAERSVVITNKGEEFELPRPQTMILAFMIRSRTRVLSYGQIIENVWGEEGAVQRNAVQKAIGRRNEAFAKHGLKPVTKYIWNYGYEFTGTAG